MSTHAFPARAVDRDRLRVLRDSLIDTDILVDDRRLACAMAEQQADGEGLLTAERALDEAVALRNRVARDLAALLERAIAS